MKLRKTIKVLLFVKEERIMTGKWKYEELSGCMLPEKVATGWTQVFSNHCLLQNINIQLFQKGLAKNTSQGAYQA